MLNDEHLKIPYYEPDSNKVFPGLSTPIKGELLFRIEMISRIMEQ